MTRALVLSGCGARGGFQAGVVQEPAEAGQGCRSVVCGVSAGVLNSLLASLRVHPILGYGRRLAVTAEKHLAVPAVPELR